MKLTNFGWIRMNFNNNFILKNIVLSQELNCGKVVQKIQVPKRTSIIYLHDSMFTSISDSYLNRPPTGTDKAIPFQSISIDFYLHFSNCWRDNSSCSRFRCKQIVLMESDFFHFYTIEHISWLLNLSSASTTSCKNQPLNLA